MDCSTPGFLVLHYLLEFAQTHVHGVGDAIQPSHPLRPLLLPSIFPSPPVFLPGKSHGQRSPVSYSPWAHKDSDTTEMKQQVKEASLKRLHAVSQLQNILEKMKL